MDHEKRKTRLNLFPMSGGHRCAHRMLKNRLYRRGKSLPIEPRLKSKLEILPSRTDIHSYAHNVHASLSRHLPISLLLHPALALSLSLSLSPPLCLSISLSPPLPLPPRHDLSVCRSFYLSISGSLQALAIHLSIYPPTNFSVYLPICRNHTALKTHTT